MLEWTAVDSQENLKVWALPSRLYETNSGIFTSDGQAVLVDPGIFPDEIEVILSLAAREKLAIRAILLTHSHWDHILGPERMADIPIIAQASFSKTAAGHKETILEAIYGWENEHRLSRPRRFMIPEPDLRFEKDLEFNLGSATLRFLAAPGHWSDQCIVYNPASRVLWAADMLSDIEIPLVSHSLPAYRETLEWIAQLEIEVLIPGHGHPTTDRKEIQARLSGDRKYLEKLDNKVRQAIADGKSLRVTVREGMRITYRQEKQNAEYHRLNIESAFLAAGGDPGEVTVTGWGKAA